MGSGTSAAQWTQRASEIRISRDRKVAEQREKIQKELQSLRLSTDKVQHILNAPVTELVSMLNDGNTTSYELTLIFAERCATLGLVNCWMTEEMFDQALEQARKCDQVRRQTRQKNRTMDEPEKGFPFLYGIPISIKDTIDVKGMSSTIGATARYDKKFQEDGVIAHCLKNSGMIPIVKSNIPQLGMTFETVNHLFGRATNPWDETRAVGGSSGGEAALIAGRCTPLGVGSDIGGSIRIPAQFCGVYALKGSSNRFSVKGHTFFQKALNGNLAIPLTVGPLGRSVDDLALFMRVMTDPQNYDRNKLDPYILHVPFNFKLYKNIGSGLRIGFFSSLKLIQSSMASQRAVREVVTALESMGHKTIEIELPHESQLIGVFYEFMAAEGNLKSYRAISQGQPFISEYRTVTRLFSLPNFVLNMLSKVTKHIKPRLSYLISSSKSKDAYEYLCLVDRQLKLKQQFIELWRRLNLDFIICPGFGCQAVKHTFAEHTTLAAAYNFIWNLLETPTGSIPITRVKEEEQRYPKTYSDPINDHMTESALGSVGLPVGIQVVGLPNQDEKVLGLMKVLEGAFPFYKQNAYPK